MSATMQSEGSKRMLWLFSNLIGQIVQVTLTENTTFEGVLTARSGTDILLSHARLKTSTANKGDAKSCPRKQLILKGSDIAYVSCIDVLLTENEAVSIHGFKTDTDISRVALGRERQLEHWLGDDSSGELLEATASSNKNGGIGGWDQFKTNEQITGQRSTYTEDYYTTKLDKTKLSAEQQRQAENIAQQIESDRYGGTRDAKQFNWSDDVDEETIHSAVTRPEDQRRQEEEQRKHFAATGSAYIPPSRRNKDDFNLPDQQQQQQPSPPVMPASMPLPLQSSQTGALPTPSLLQRPANDAPPLTIPAECYESQLSPAPKPAADPQPSSSPPAPSQKLEGGRIGAELLKVGEKKGPAGRMVCSCWFCIYVFSLIFLLQQKLLLSLQLC